MEDSDEVYWYKELKRRHPDSLLLILQGLFYETFGADAVALAKTCGAPLLTPTLEPARA